MATETFAVERDTYFRYWLSFVFLSFLPDSNKHIAINIWLIFFIFFKFLLGFWMHFSLKYSIQHIHPVVAKKKREIEPTVGLFKSDKIKC